MSNFITALKAASQAGETLQPMADVAKILVDGGWPVFPCNLDKKPLVPGGFRARTTNMEQVNAWWRVHPNALPAIVPGDGKLAAVDVDSALAAMLTRRAGISFTEGLIVQTGGTSAPFRFDDREWPPMHVYVSTETPLTIPGGVVVRQHSGYVIAPGARRSERVYKAITTADPVTFAPTPVQRPIAGSRDVAPDAERALALLRSIPNNFEREAWVGVAHMVRGALGEEGREPFLQWCRTWAGGKVNDAENARVWDTLPPSNLGWTALWKLAGQQGADVSAERDQEAQVEFDALPDPSPPAEETTGLLNKDQLIRAAKRIYDAPDDFERARAYYYLRKAGFTMFEVNLLLRGISSKENDDASFYSLQELLAKPELLETPPAVVPNLAWAGMKTVLAAREKMGKTTFALAGVAVTTRGEPFLGEPTTPITVLWMTEEPPQILVQRARDFGVDPNRFFVLPMGRNPPAQLKLAVEKLHPGLVVIDTLYRFAMLEEENQAGAWLPVVLQLDEVSRSGASLLLLAHSQKSSEVGEYRGSTAIGGHVDAILTMRKPKEGERTRRLDGRGRLAMGKPFSVIFSGTDFQILSETQEESIDSAGQKDKIWKSLQGSGPQTQRDLARALHIRSAALTPILKDMLEKKEVAHDGRRWRLISPEEEFTTQETT